MLHEIFYWVFNMSITATITGLIVLLIRKIPVIPSRIRVLLWIIPFIRMVIPFGLNTRYNIVAMVTSLFGKNVSFLKASDSISLSSINSLQMADKYFPITYKQDIFEQIFTVAAIIWAVAAIAVILTLSVIYITTLCEIKNAEHFKDKTYFSDKVKSPAVYGIIKPKIVLPHTFKDKDITFILAHEKAHIRYADNLWRSIAFLTAAVHWFNPLSWIFLKLFLADIELACDERVVAKLGQDRAKEYALSLLESKKSTNILVSAFGGARIRMRVEKILSFKRLTIFSLIGFAVLLIALFYALLTNAC